MTSKEWIEHFLSVSHIMGEYEGEYWTLPYNGKCWKIIGKQSGFKFYSLINDDRTEYTDARIILRELLLLEPQTMELLK